MNRNKLVLILVFATLFLTSGVLASFVFVGDSLGSSYSAGDKLTGIIKIKFVNQDANSLFTSNFNGSISVKDLIEKNNLTEGEDYNCSFPGCGNVFKTKNAITTKQLSGESYVGLSVKGKDFLELNTLSFRIIGSSPASCFSQISVDLLGDGENLMTNNAYTTNTCFTRKYGCFENNLTGYQTATIPSSGGYYCEKIKLPPGPAYKVGANVIKSTSGNSSLIMELFNTNEISLGSCELPNQTQSTEERSCIVKYSSSEEKDYFVCLKADDSSNYKIRTETNNPCGTNNFGDTYPIDYEIFAENLQFGSVDMNLDEDIFVSDFGESIVEYIGDYIYSKYGNDCDPECVIPIKISGQSQSLQFENINLLYNIDGAEGVESHDIFDLETESSKVNSGNISLELSHANFIVPSTNSTKKFNLFLEGKQVLNKTIDIKPSFDFSLNPRFVSFGQLANFRMETSENITDSVWDFGDGGTFISKGKTAEHRYLSEGQFNLRVEATNNKGIVSARSFSITVGDAKEIANTTIKTYSDRIGKLDKEISSFPVWVSNEVRKKIDLVLINASLNKLKNDYDASLGDEDYKEVMLGLIDLDVPSSIKVGESGTLPLVLGYSEINPEYIEELTGDSEASLEALREAITVYSTMNYNSEITFQKIQAFRDSSSEKILTKFKIKTNPLGTQESTNYLIFGESIDRIKFAQSYGERSVADGTYIALKDSSEEIEFLVADDLNPEELGAYISTEVPKLGDLDFTLLTCNYNKICEKGNGENKENCSNDCRPWGWFTIWMAGLLFGFIVAYIIIQEWYKKNYERKLFKKPEFLYNVINFIYNARRQGLSDGQIKSKLKDATWTGEQISYAMKKIAGKRTGMFEIPVFKAAENRKVRQEIQMRQQGKLDKRFMKKQF